MVEIWRWPKASLSASLTACMEMPRRPAVSRSTRTIAQSRRKAQPFHEAGCPVGHILLVAANEGVLVERPADARADLHVLYRLEVDEDAGDGGHLFLQSIDDVCHGGAPQVAWLERDLEMTSVRRGIERAHADHGDHTLHVGIGASNAGDRRLQLDHFRK